MSFGRDVQQRPGETAVSRHDVAVPGKRTLVDDLPPVPHPVQRSTAGGGDAPTGPEVHAAAAHGTSGPSSALPHLDLIQRAFGRFDVSHVKAHVGGPAAEGAAAMGADAFAAGNRVAFASQPDLHTAAHESAHVVQQRGGVQLKGGVGEADDAHEQHADAVADRVVAGESAEELLEDYAGGGDGGETVAEGGGGGEGHPVQRHVFINGNQVKVGPTRKILRRGWQPMTGVTRQMRAMAKDQLVRDYQSKAEFQQHAAGQTDYLGNLNNGAHTWVRFSPNGTNVLGESHIEVTLQDVVRAVGSTSFIYEPFSSDNLPDGHMKTAYETENAQRFNSMGVGAVADKQQFGGESLFPKMGYGLNYALPYLDGTMPLDDLKPGRYVGQPLQRYLKIAWGHSQDNRAQVLQNQQNNAQVTPTRLALANIHAQVTGQLDAFIAALPIDGYLGDELDTPQHQALVGPGGPLAQFAHAFVDAMVELAAEDPSSRLSQQRRQDIVAGNGPATSQARDTLFSDWRNHTFEDALNDAVGRGVRYAGMGNNHLVHLRAQGLPPNTHAFDMRDGEDFDAFADHTADLAGRAVQQ